MKNEEVQVYVPATVANVACGFDILGFAVAEPGDKVVARKSETPGVTIEAIEGDEGRLPREASRNSASVAAQAVLSRIGATQGITLSIYKQMPLGSGLGSSAASSAAGAFATNHLFGTPLSLNELVGCAMQGEEVACGTAHADNVAPALFGGFVLIRSYDPLDLVRIRAPKQLHCTILHPHIEVRTEDARRILRRDIPLKSAITQWGNIAGLIAGLLEEDLPLIGRSLQDVIIEPERALLIPGFHEMKQAALRAGALGCSISGSGPSVFALCNGATTALKVGVAMQEVSTALGIGSDLFLSNPGAGSNYFVIRR